MKLTDLKIWEKSRQFRNEVASIAKLFPSDEKFLLKNQIIRSSRSVSANIAEGHGRYHYQENIQFCRMARGSLVETFDHLTVALDEKYLIQSEFNKFADNYEELMKMINGYIQYLNNRKLES